jgi:hypothetical protein
MRKIILFMRTWQAFSEEEAFFNAPEYHQIGGTGVSPV